LWDISGKQLVSFQKPANSVNSVVFSLDGRWILTASDDGTARQYFVNTTDILAVATCRVGRGLTDEEIARFRAHAAQVRFRQAPVPTGARELNAMSRLAL
jgi:WD40 repeat protein